jgi:two-component system chemotaxis response regulator CheY
MLREIGFRDIAQARDGHDALSQIETADPGLIICDISMQPMDGLEFVETLRQHSWPHAAEVPVIFLTSHTEAPIVKRAFKLGVEAYVVKPVQKKQLEVRVIDNPRASPGETALNRETFSLREKLAESAGTNRNDAVAIGTFFQRLTKKLGPRGP